MNTVTKRLGLIFAVILIIAALRPFWGSRYDAFFNERFNSQWRNLRQVEQHIAAIQPKWKTFTNENPGFDMVHLFAYTGGDGLFGAYGYIESDEKLSQLRTFMEETAPPRPLYLGSVNIVGPDGLEILRKAGSAPVEAANGSQPVRSATNSTSAAAGSRR